MANEQSRTTGHFRGLDHVLVPRYQLEGFQNIMARYEALARAECRRQGIDPDDIISDAGHAAWELVGYEAARKEVPDVR